MMALCQGAHWVPVPALLWFQDDLLPLAPKELLSHGKINTSRIGFTGRLWGILGKRTIQQSLMAHKGKAELTPTLGLSRRSHPMIMRLTGPMCARAHGYCRLEKHLL